MTPLPPWRAVVSVGEDAKGRQTVTLECGHVRSIDLIRSELVLKRSSVPCIQCDPYPKDAG